MDLFHKRIENAMQKAKQMGAKNIQVVYRDGRTAFLPAEYVIQSLTKPDCGGIVSVAGEQPIVKWIAGLLDDSVQ